MTNLRLLSETEIINRAEQLYSRMDLLIFNMSKMISEKKGDSKLLIETYNNLKNDILAESRYLRTPNGDISNVSATHKKYMTALIETCDKNFSCHIDQPYIQSMLSSVSSAYSDFGYYFEQEL